MRAPIVMFAVATFACEPSAPPRAPSAGAVSTSSPPNDPQTLPPIKGEDRALWVVGGVLIGGAALAIGAMSR